MINLGDIFVRKEVVGNNDDYKIILVAHPEHKNRYLIAYKNENT